MLRIFFFFFFDTLVFEVFKLLFQSFFSELEMSFLISEFCQILEILVQSM